MFTGIIDHPGIVTLIQKMQNGLRLEIKHSFPDLGIGESIAINGICLTVTEFKQDLFYCELSPETLRLTTAKYIQLDQSVNLERALQPLSRIGGHFVTGHIDQVAQVLSIQSCNDFIEMKFGIFDELMQRFLIKKGSIAINGVSLTINEIARDSVSVMLIPHTLVCTNFKQLQQNDWVNVEFDMLTKTVVKQLESLIQ